MVVVTGGDFTKTKATQYDMTGYKGELNELQTGRSNHACGHYVDDNQQQV